MAWQQKPLNAMMMADGPVDLVRLCHADFDRACVSMGHLDSIMTPAYIPAEEKHRSHLLDSMRISASLSA